MPASITRSSLAEVRAPTLLVVGGNDPVILDLNEEAARRLTSRTQIEIIPGAGHLFEAPGALEQVAELTLGWFEANL